MARRRAKSHDLVFLIGAALLIAFIWGAFEFTKDTTDDTPPPPDPDSDGDGLLDEWEQQYFGGLAQTAAGDYDNDDISNLDEFKNGTDPTVPAHVQVMPSVYGRNYDVNMSYNVTLFVDGVEALNRTIDAAPAGGIQIVNLNKIEVQNGTHNLTVVTRDLTGANATWYFDLDIQKMLNTATNKTEDPKLYLDISETVVMLRLTTLAPKDAPAAWD